MTKNKVQLLADTFLLIGGMILGAVLLFALQSVFKPTPPQELPARINPAVTCVDNQGNLMVAGLMDSVYIDQGYVVAFREEKQYILTPALCEVDWVTLED